MRCFRKDSQLNENYNFILIVAFWLDWSTVFINTVYPDHIFHCLNLKHNNH